MDGAGENLRGRGGKAVDDHRQRPAPDGVFVGVRVDVGSVAHVRYLHDRPGLHEQPGEFHGFLQRTTAVVAQIDDQPIDAFGLQFANEPRHVAGGAGVVGIAVSERLEVDVEGRHGHHADSMRSPAVFDIEYRPAGRLLLQLDDVADNRDHPGLHNGRARRHHLQQHWRALGAANEIHNLVGSPADDVHERFVIALADGDDAVGGLQVPAHIRRPAFDEPLHHRVFVFRAQHRADAFQRQRHVDVEVRRVAWREILRVPVVGLREGVDEQLEYILAACLADQPQAVLGALGQRLANVLKFLTRQLAAEDAALERQAPLLFGLFLGLRPGGFATVQLHGLVDGEVESVQAPLQHRHLVFHPLQRTAAEDVVDLEGRLQLAIAQRVVQLDAMPLEGGDVVGAKEDALGVQKLQVFVEYLAGHLVVQRLGLVQVMLAEPVEDGDAGASVGGERRQIVVVFRLRAGNGKRQGERTAGERQLGGMAENHGYRFELPVGRARNVHE